MAKENNQQIILYQAADKHVELEVRLRNETVWLTQKQIAVLFGVVRNAVTKHINNIFNSTELSEDSVCSILEHTAADGKVYKVKYYNLDMVISIGYRINSKWATQFRVWATQTLKKYLLDGFVLNEKRLRERESVHVRELEEATVLLQQAIARRDLRSGEARGLLKVITDYTSSWLLLHKYDQDKLVVEKTQRRVAYRLTYDNAVAGINRLCRELQKKKEAGDLFGHEREHMLASIIGNIHQSFGGHELYPSIEEKAAHLLYFVIKDHPFNDGNKRIGAFLFIWFLARNRYLHTKKGEKKINDNALVALALLIAESAPVQKDVMIKLVVNLINKR